MVTKKEISIFFFNLMVQWNDQPITLIAKATLINQNLINVKINIWDERSHRRWINQSE